MKVQEALKSEDVYIFDINQPFVTQEQKFKYWEESKAEIKRLKSALAEIDKCEPVAYMYHVKEEKPTSVKQHTFAALDGYVLQQNETLIYKEPLYDKPQPREWVGLSVAQMNSLRSKEPTTNIFDFIKLVQYTCRQNNTEGKS